ncbi:hypothetical protein R3P38DRAFT_950449 [Favolaschia claudopus]|uniref:Uncharacterized protein n=1 Tax=Favolaschia claudopus TaxID=2862362 RepID=A0AAW0BLH3_9AGAR
MPLVETFREEVASLVCMFMRHHTKGLHQFKVLVKLYREVSPAEKDFDAHEFYEKLRLSTELIQTRKSQQDPEAVPLRIFLTQVFPEKNFVAFDNEWRIAYGRDSGRAAKTTEVDARYKERKAKALNLKHQGNVKIRLSHTELVDNSQNHWTFSYDQRDDLDRILCRVNLLYIKKKTADHLPSNSHFYETKALQTALAAHFDNELNPMAWDIPLFRLLCSGSATFEFTLYCDLPSNLVVRLPDDPVGELQWNAKVLCFRNLYRLGTSPGYVLKDFTGVLRHSQRLGIEDGMTLSGSLSWEDVLRQWSSEPRASQRLSLRVPSAKASLESASMPGSHPMNLNPGNATPAKISPCTTPQIQTTIAIIDRPAQAPAPAAGIANLPQQSSSQHSSPPIRGTPTRYAVPNLGGSTAGAPPAAVSSDSGKKPSKIGFFRKLLNAVGFGGG